MLNCSSQSTRNQPIVETPPPVRLQPQTVNGLLGITGVIWLGHGEGTQKIIHPLSHPNIDAKIHKRLRGERYIILSTFTCTSYPRPCWESGQYSSLASSLKRSNCATTSSAGDPGRYQGQKGRDSENDKSPCPSSRFTLYTEAFSRLSNLESRSVRLSIGFHP